MGLIGYMCIGDDITDQKIAQKKWKPGVTGQKWSRLSSGLVYDYEHETDQIIE